MPNSFVKFVEASKKSLLSLFSVLFFILGIDSVGVYIYNIISVPMKYGSSFIWQPIVSNVNFIGFGLIYFILSYLLAKKRKEIDDGVHKEHNSESWQ